MEPTTSIENNSPLTKTSSHRTFVFSLIIVAAVVVAGIVILAANRDLMDVSSPQNEYSAPVENEGGDAVAENLRVQSGSNELGDIEADLNATSFDNIEE